MDRGVRWRRPFEEEGTIQCRVEALVRFRERHQLQCRGGDILNVDAFAAIAAEAVAERVRGCRIQVGIAVSGLRGVDCGQIEEAEQPEQQKRGRSVHPHA